MESTTDEATRELDARMHDAAKCSVCGNFAWDRGMMEPAYDPLFGKWHHPSCKYVPGARAAPTAKRLQSATHRTHPLAIPKHYANAIVGLKRQRLVVRP